MPVRMWRDVRCLFIKRFFTSASYTAELDALLLRLCTLRRQTVLYKYRAKQELPVQSIKSLAARILAVSVTDSMELRASITYLPVSCNQSSCVFGLRAKIAMNWSANMVSCLMRRMFDHTVGTVAKTQTSHVRAIVGRTAEVENQTVVCSFVADLLALSAGVLWPIHIRIWCDARLDIGFYYCARLDIVCCYYFLSCCCIAGSAIAHSDATTSRHPVRTKPLLILIAGSTVNDSVSLAAPDYAGAGLSNCLHTIISVHVCCLHLPLVQQMTRHSMRQAGRVQVVASNIRPRILHHRFKRETRQPVSSLMHW
eukprot:jgi/Ulvmu1/12748/UM095_0053.1